MVILDSPYTSQVIVAIIPIIGLTALILLLNVYAPSSSDLRVYKYTVPIVSQVRGRVIEVPVEEGNRLVKKGDVLFRVDPTPYQLTVNQLEAQLLNSQAGQRELDESLKQAKGKVVESTASIEQASGRVRQVTARLELARLRVKQNRELASTGAGSKFELERSETDARELEAQLDAARSVQAQARAAEVQARAAEQQIVQKLSAKTDQGRASGGDPRATGARTLGTGADDGPLSACAAFVCNQQTGLCEHDPPNDPAASTPCPDVDRNLCTTAGCDGLGNCNQGHIPTVCPPDGNPCTDPPVCNPGTGLCEEPPTQPSTPCPDIDGDPCTIAGCDGFGVCNQTHVPCVTTTTTSTSTSSSTSSSSTTSTLPLCGNGVLDGGEECDPAGSITCPAGSPGGAFLPCSQICTCCVPSPEICNNMSDDDCDGLVDCDTEDDRLKLLSFTGSPDVGWKLKAPAGRKKVVLELGGNAACIVDADQADRLDAVVERLVFGAFYQSGQ